MSIPRSTPPDIPGPAIVSPTRIGIHAALAQLPDTQRQQFLQRFNTRIEPTPDGHELWTGALTDSGYARLSFAGSDIYAHRLTWVIAHGRDPLPELAIDHICRVRHCVAAAHLREVTQRENILAGESPVAHNAAKLFCIRSHPLMLGHPNTYIAVDGSRRCRACRTAQRRKDRARALLAEQVALFGARTAAGEAPDPVKIHIRGRNATEVAS